MTYDSLNDWNERMTAREFPFYLIGQDGAPLPEAPRFRTEDEAFAWTEANLGADAWNDSAILASEGVAS